MMYNKNEFHKSNEKKLLRKVKKQWVTVSVSMLAFGGAMAVSLYESPSHLMGIPTTVEAHADSTVNKNDQNSGEVKKNNDNAQTISKSLNSNGNNNSQASNDAGVTSTANTNVNSAPSGSNITSDYNNASNANSDANTQSSGYSYASNASNSNSNASNNVTSANNNYSALHDEYNTASQANAINNTLGSNGNDSYKSVSNAYLNISSAYNDATAKSSSIPNNSQAVTNANKSVQDNYNSMKDPSTGSSAGDTNHGIKYASDKTYLNSETDDYSSLTSASGAISDASSAISADLTAANAAFVDIKNFTQTSAYSAYKDAYNDYNSATSSAAQVPSDISNTNSSNGTPLSSGALSSLSASSTQTSVYKSAYSSFLQQQAIKDAESGKWNLIQSDGKQISYQVATSNPGIYDQAYQGATQAIKDAASNANNFLGNSYNGLNDSTGTQATPYTIGYNNVAAKTRLGTAFVNNAQQMDNAIKNGEISNVSILGNINLSDVGYQSGNGTNKYDKTNGGTNSSYNSVTKTSKITSFSIDGNNHIIDYLNANYDVKFTNQSNPSVTFKNQYAYGTNDYGVIGFTTNFSDQNSTVPITLDNINYTGAQVVYNQNSTTYIKNHVIVNSMPYNNIFTNGTKRILATDSCYNLQSKTFDATSGSTYDGTDSVNSVLKMPRDANFIVENNATVTLNSESGKDNNNTGLKLDSGGSATINGKLTINVSGNNNAIDDYGNMTVDGGTVQVNLNGVSSPTPFKVAGSITSTNGGLIKVKSNDENNLSPELLDLSGQDSSMNIVNQGNLELLSDGTGTPTLLSSGSGKVNINNPGNNVIFDLDTSHPDTENKHSNGKITDNTGFTAYAVKVNNNGDNQGAFYSVRINSDGSIQYYDAKNKNPNANLNKTGTNSQATIAGSKYLSFSTSPSATIEDGDNGIKLSKYGNDNYIVSGTIKMSNNMTQINGDDKKKPIFIGIEINNGSNSQTLGNPTITDNDPSTQDGNLYTFTIDPSKITFQNGQEIPFSYVIPKSKIDGITGLSVSSHYFVSTIQKSITNGIDGNKATEKTTLVNPSPNGTIDVGSPSELGFSALKTQADTHVNPEIAAQGAANDGLNAIIAGTTKSNYPSDPKLQVAYNGAQTAYNAAQKLPSERSDSENAAINQYPDAAKYGGYAKSGITNAIDGKGDESQDYKDLGTDTRAQSAYNNAQTSYKAGASNQNSESANAKLNSTAYEVGKAAYAGAQDLPNAKSDGTEGTNYNPNNSWSQAQKAAYKSIYENNSDNTEYNQAVQDYNNDPSKYNNDPSKYKGNPSSVTDQTINALIDAARDKPTTNNISNSPIYAAANSQAIQDRQNGADDFTNGKAKPSGNNTALEQKGYDDAQAGYNAGLKGSGTDSGKSDQYNSGVVAGSSAQAGYNDAISKPNKTYGLEDHSSSAQANRGVKAALDDIQNHNGHMTDSAKYNESGNSGYRMAYQNIMSISQQARDDFQKGNTTHQPADSDPNKSVYNQAYADAQNGYQKVLTNSSVDNNSSNNANENAGIKDANAAEVKDDYQQATKDFNSATSNGAKQGLLNNPNAAYKATIQGLLNGTGIEQDSKTSEPDSNPEKILYDIAKNQSAGYSAATKPGTANAPKLNDGKSTQAEVNAYWGAKAGANTGDTEPKDGSVQKDSAAYQDALKQAQAEAAQGANEYQAAKSNNPSTDPTTLTPNESDNALVKQGYWNQQAYDQGFNNKSETKPPKYGNGWNTGQQQAYYAGHNAGKPNSSYNNTLNGTNDASSDSKGAQAGLAAAQQGKSSNPIVPSDITNPSDILKYQSAYMNAYGSASNAINDGAKQAIADNYTGINNKRNAITPLDKDFKQGYDNQVAYNAGANGKDNPYTTEPEKSATDNAYAQGKTSKDVADAAKTDAAGSGISTDRYPGNIDKQTAYEGQVQGYQDGAKGLPAKANTDQTPEYQMAYNKAYGEIQASRSEAANKFFDTAKDNGIDLSNPDKIKGLHNPYTDETTIDGKAQHNAFAEQQGYATGLVAGQDANADNYYPNGSVANEAFTEARQASAGYASAQGLTHPDPNAIVDSNGHTILNGDTPADQAAREAYRATASAFQDAKAGKRTNNSNQSTAYQMAYNMAYNANQNAMTNGQNDALGLNGANNQASGLTQAQKTLYNQAKQDANYGYASVMNPANDKASSTDKSSTAYQTAVQVAKNLQDGINAATGGAKTAPSADAKAGFAAAQAAIQTAKQDAQANKYPNGKVDISKVQVPDKYSNSVARQAYLDVYQGTYDGYNAGLNGGSQTTNNPNVAYQAAYKAAFKQGQNDVPAPAPAPDNNGAASEAGSTDFLDNGTTPSFNNPDQANAYQKARQETKSGFDAALSGVDQQPNASKYYGNGYAAAKAGLQGIAAAKSGAGLGNNTNKSYISGYQGYQNGTAAGKLSAKASKRAAKKALAGKDAVYVYAYKQAMKNEARRQNNEGIKAGLAAAKTGKMAHNLSNHSAAYVQAYKKAFRKEFTRHTPRYVYNIGGMYLHNSNKFSKSSRIKGYAKATRGKAHVFKVLGVTFSKSGLPRYRVAGGYITANDKHVADAYYRHNETKPNQKVRVIKPEGTFIYKGKKFNAKNSFKKAKKNEVVHVKKLVKVGDITRFYVGNGKYISSNKTIVERVH